MTRSTIAAIALVLWSWSCRTASQPASNPAPREVPASSLVDRSGDSLETAIEVPADAPLGGIRFENDWIFDHYGRFRRAGGGTGTASGRRYDVVKIELPGGDQKTVYFDITENWKRWSPQ